MNPTHTRLVLLASVLLSTGASGASAAGAGETPSAAGAGDALSAAGPPPAAPRVELAYPSAPRGDQVDDYHGTKVPDPYRGLEDIDSPQTRAWVEKEGALARRYLDALPGREKLTQRVRAVWNYERWTPPARHGTHWFYFHNDGLQNQNVLYVTDDPAATTPGRVLIDPNTLSADGTVALRETAVTDDGRLIAYAVSEAGSDWQVWHVRDVEQGVDRPDQLHWSKDSNAAWRKDASGFYYTVFDAPTEQALLKAANQYQRLYFHKLGTPQSDDVMIYTRRDAPDWFFDPSVTQDGRYLIVAANRGTDVKNALLAEDLTASGGLKPVIAEPTAEYDPIDTVGTLLYVRTDDGAARYRIVAIDLEHPERAHWRVIVPEGADSIVAAHLVGGQLIVETLHDAHTVVRRFGTDGHALGDVALPGIGTASGFEGQASDRVTYYSYSSFSHPPSVFRLDLVTGAVSGWRSPALQSFVPANYETEERFVQSRDGTRVPLFITARRGTRKDGSNPTILFGYGGFDIAVTPSFSPAIAAWLESGGVYAVACLRGGGEYGRTWHEAGMKTHKQHVFDDFIAAGTDLVQERWTSPARLALRGGSNGGLLVAAVELQRPDLAAVAIPEVGVLDMLRFREFTVGKAWESDYGSVDQPEEFKALAAYSPVHNVRAGVPYPATLILTGDHDDRVFPAHSFKFAAAMQNADPHGKPILLRVETRAGHGQGMPTAKRIESVVDVYAFILDAMHVTPR
jgi:prolyl oligopeptidase